MPRVAHLLFVFRARLRAGLAANRAVRQSRASSASRTSPEGRLRADASSGALDPRADSVQPQPVLHRQGHERGITAELARDFEHVPEPQARPAASASGP
jgi:hypothetical protein